MKNNIRRRQYHETRSDRNFTKIPDGKLGIIALEGCKELGKTIDNYIIQWRSETFKDFKDSVACDGYLRDTYLLDASCPRFGSGEAKGIIRESVRDMDLYIIVDVLELQRYLLFKWTCEPYVSR